MNDKQIVAIMAAILHAQQFAQNGAMADEHNSVKDAEKLFTLVKDRGWGQEDEGAL
jgi:hypothetical protein